MKYSDDVHFTIMGAEKHMPYVRSLHSMELSELRDAIEVRELELMAVTLLRHGITSLLQPTAPNCEGMYFRYLCVYDPTGGVGVWATAAECRRLLDTVANLPASEAFARWAPKVEPLAPIEYSEHDARRDIRAERAQAKTDYDAGRIDSWELAIAHQFARSYMDYVTK